MVHHRYTADQKAYLREVIPGHSHREIAEMVNERFGLELTVRQIAAFCKNNHISTGRTGRFEKGQVSHNKGKKGVCAPGSEKGWFAKGNVAVNSVPIGTEKVRSDGYVWVKVQDGHGRFNWVQKNTMVWEAANGPVPAGHVLIFANGDKADARLENLLLVERSDLAVMNHRGLHGRDVESSTAAVLTAKIIRRTRALTLKKDKS